MRDLQTRGARSEAPNTTQLHHFFEAHADRTPEAPAIVCGEMTLTYQDVDRRANRIARHLRTRGVKTGDRVGLFVERSPDAIVAILSILKAGAAYLPLDPTHPVDRLRHILDEASVATLVTETELETEAHHIASTRVVAINDPQRPWDTEPADRLSTEETGLTPSHLCYVLYTSGSTGKPKGVMTEHRNATSFVAAFNQVLDLDADDRVFQGFSLSFDGSVEEMWMAFSNGAALIVPKRGAARFGSDLARLITNGKASVFSTVPTSLALIEDPLSAVRVLIVSGERCPKEAVKRWATPGRRMLNVYGPTETTVNATVAECQPDRAVTIGVPLPGYRLHVRGEGGFPVGPGEKGELYIAGPGVARGYLGQPTLTEKHFLELPVADAPGGAERAYRTGDLVSFDERGELLFHGRLDNQVKLRGFRVELSEIEAVLGEHEAIRAAAVTMVERDGTSELCAHVVMKEPGREIDRNSLLAALASRLPSYMIPTFLDVVTALPTLASGKVDRKRLPPPLAALLRTDRTIVAPQTALEADLLRIYSRLLRSDSISTDDDFFTTLGGYSLRAAQLVTDLRKELRLQVALRDVYEHPTIAGLAAHLTSLREEREIADGPRTPVVKQASSRRVFQSLPRGTWAICAALQALALYVVYGVMTLPYLGTFFPLTAWREGRISFTTCAGEWLLLGLGTWPALLAVSVAAKWLLIGRYRAGAYPLWGSYYLRWWVVRRFQLISGSSMLAGTPLMSLYLRAMGAKVGRDCTIDSAAAAIFDLLSIGDDTSIGSETQLLGYRIEDGYLLIGSVDIGSRCFVGIHSALGLDVGMGDDTRLDDLSLLPDGTSIASGEAWRGSPAGPAEVSLPEPSRESPARRRAVLFGALHAVVIYLVGVALIPAALPGWEILAWAESRSWLWRIASIPAAGMASMVAFCLWLAVLKRIILPRVKPGVYPVHSGLYLRKWTADLLLQLSRSIARPVYTTIYLPPWLRLLGAKIGRRAEISTVSQFSPELTSIGEQSFLADGSMIGGRRVHRGLIDLAESHVGRRSFVGNGAIVPTGQSLGDGSLLACLSAPPAGRKQPEDGTEWLGSPSFALRHRPKFEGFGEAVTHEPTRKLIAQRLLIDALRIAVPATLVTGGFVAFSALLELAYERLPLAQWLLALPLLAIMIAAGGLVCTVITKKVLVGTFTPTVQPLWSVYVWLNEAVNGTYETVASPVLSLLLGTPYAAPWLRGMGCKIGRHVYLETTLFSEFDLVHLGDYSALNAGAVIQNHLFEDRVMKASVLHVGEDCSVGNMAVVLYDTVMQTGSSIGPLSLLMKGETLPPETRWAGIPTAQASRWVASPASLLPAPPAEVALMEG